ncbi:hypothetical protein ACQ45_gp42 [Citrobacter phage Stevie]|uniref:Uncharacterized protein n=1 Tax=Citrobacter phage Stevie TaxID=2885922 RepID=A0A0A0YQN5_9CAUD|nr:hypothetical protein ACQ45_gp42 [Citrobacter phage Stevie]AIX12311.1 hypothetical protein CPT_Stevie42 [Citrobacter phage Stevie]
MKNYSASQHLIDLILKESSAMRVSHDDLVYSLLLLLYSDMRAFGDNEHQLTNDDGELLIHVRRFE